MINFFKKLFLPITATLGFIQNYFKSLLFLIIVFLIFSATSEESIHKPNLMKINLSGPIFEAESVLEKIEEAENDNIKGVLLVVNSPGGAVAPSIEIALAIKKLQEKKPVIAYAAGTMASGSYYASIYSDKIISNPGSTIGSIGVLFQSPNFKELADKIGIKEQVIAAGKYKQIGTPTREWMPYEKEELTRLINDTYDMFVTDVANARGLDINNSTTFADAHVFSAKRAKEVGLIDELGSIYEAKEAIKESSKVTNPVWKSEDKFDKIIDKLAQEGFSQVFSHFYGLKAF